jgi:hypothetical protein
MSEIMLVPFLGKLVFVTGAYPLAISRLLMSFLTFHTAIFLSAMAASVLMVA